MRNRDRLIELLKPHVSGTACLCESGSCELTSCRDCKARRLADHLIENGVILLPCKVGDTVFVPWHWNGEHGIAVANVQEIKIYDSKNHSMFLIDLQSDDEEFNQSFGGWKLDESIGKTIFLFYEEAEKKLERSRGNE